MHAIADRFIDGTNVVLDLATGNAVTLRRLPPCDTADQRRWSATCSRLLGLWHEDMPLFVDYGFTPDGRFEAFGRVPLLRRPAGAEQGAALRAFLDPDRTTRVPGGSGPLRIGMRLVSPSALGPLLELLDDGRAGWPLVVSCVADPGAGATTFLRMAAAEGRRRGYVPVAVEVLDRWPALADVVRDRSVLLLADTGISARRCHRWLLHLGSASPHGHVLLQVGPQPDPASDVALRLEPLGADVLAAHVHVSPDGRVPDARIRLAAARSGGLPARFIAHLRTSARALSSVPLVAEARPAYVPDPEPAIEQVDHPWRDLIADAVRLFESGRRAAAERSLRQIAAAARRRQLALPAAAAEIELAGALLTRGRTREAQELFRASADACRANTALAARAALGLAAAHLAQGDIEAAESAYRVCRTVTPVSAAIGLSWTMCSQGRYADAERVLRTVHDSAGALERGSLCAAAAGVALGRQDLPAAARAAEEALSVAGADRKTECAAAELLVAIHGRIGDRDGVERYAARALVAARAAGAPLQALSVRGTVIEARHACGCPDAPGKLDRVLRISERLPPLVRARLWAVASQAHPVEERRREYTERLRAFMVATGVRGLLPDSTPDGRGTSLAADVAALVAIHESAPTALEAVQRVADWVRDRANTRAVVVSDSDGALIARSGPHDAIAAARRVLTTRVAQPPWATPAGLEAAAPVRYAGSVYGVLACRWPLSQNPSPAVMGLIAIAASVLGPAVSALADRSRAPVLAGDGMIGRSAAIQRVRDFVSRAGPAPFSVLIEGESGSGKELVAKAVHRESPRRLRPCVAVNCAALADELFEAEMFGHARGAFTGAHVERAGLFEQADGGTLFLDEVSELSPRAQAKLLRTLQEGEVRRIGESHARRVDVRVIAASNRQLDDEVSAGRFRRDLLFRLAVVRIAVPALRDRTEDIPLLAAHYWEAAARRAVARSVLTTGAVARLVEHDWPGNVRELQNVMAALAVQVPRGRVQAAHVCALIGRGRTEPGAGGHEAVRLEDARKAFERRFISATMARCGGRHSAAARELGISRQGLSKLLRRLHLRDEERASHEKHKT